MPTQSRLSAPQSDRPSGQHLAPAGRGRSLPATVQAKMEAAFGHDFSGVRIHEGGQAESLGAIAYTRGRDIHFAPGRYSPQSRPGQELLGHELAHVVQQSQGRVALPQGKGAQINADPGLESEAERLGRAAARGHSLAGFTVTPAKAGGGESPPQTGSQLRIHPSVPTKPLGKPQVLQLGKTGKKRKRAPDPWEQFKRAYVEQKDLPLELPDDSDFKAEEEPPATHKEDAKLDQAGASLDLGPSFSILTSNVEKLGKSTPRKLRAKKIKLLANTVHRSAPSLASFQEVTEPELLSKGSPATQRLPQVYGLTNQPLWSSPNSEYPKETLSSQYAFLSGPSYKSGNYKESYSLLSDTGLIHNPPTLSFFPDNDTRLEDYDGQTLPFGKEVDLDKKDPKSARPTTVWNVSIPNGRFNLRPPTKGWGDDNTQTDYAEKHKNLIHRDIPYTNVQVLNVHTSPSIATIPKQVDQILEQHEALEKENPRVVSAGDWYMQKSSKRNWSRLKKSKTLSLDEPGVQTNFPSKGEGQTADHFVSSRRGLKRNGVQALAPPEFSKSNSAALEDTLDKDNRPSAEQLETWTESGIDHAPVLALYKILPTKDRQK